MRDSEGGGAYEKFRDDQIALASADDLMLILANELVRLKEETGMNLFWDRNEEQFMRDYIENAETLAQS
jgi:hypothetical protein